MLIYFFGCFENSFQEICNETSVNAVVYDKIYQSLLFAFSLFILTKLNIGYCHTLKRKEDQCSAFCIVATIMILVVDLEAVWVSIEPPIFALRFDNKSRERQRRLLDRKLIVRKHCRWRQISTRDVLILTLVMTVFQAGLKPAVRLGQPQHCPDVEVYFPQIWRYGIFFTLSVRYVGLLLWLRWIS